jgi:hypothetical protein
LLAVLLISADTGNGITPQEDFQAGIAVAAQFEMHVSLSQVLHGTAAQVTPLNFLATTVANIVDHDILR